MGWAYCVRRYIVDKQLGRPLCTLPGSAGTAKRGIRLILDFVPNHVARDRPGAIVIIANYFVQGNLDDAESDPASFVNLAGDVFTC